MLFQKVRGDHLVGFEPTSRAVTPRSKLPRFYPNTPVIADRAFFRYRFSRSDSITVVDASES